MATIQITSTNYNGQTAQVTFYSVSAPNTPVNLGPQTLPYSRSGNDVYGSYELNFTAYNKVCVVTLDGTTTTTTTTTAVPTTSTTTTAAPTTTTTTTAAPTTTTTTTAAPGVAGYVVSGAGDTNYNGTYCFAGTSQGKNYYQKDTYYIAFIAGWNNWVIQSESTGGLNPFMMPDYNIYVGGDNSMDDTPPTGEWSYAAAPPPAPSLTLTTCGGTTTTATPTTTTTTTTTAAPTTGYTVSGATYEPAVNGTYSIAGSINGTTYYSKTLGGTFYLHKSIDSFSNDYPEWNITSWPPCEGGTRDCFFSGPSYYTLTAPSSPPVSGWWNPGNGEDTAMTVTMN